MRPACWFFATAQQHSTNIRVTWQYSQTSIHYMNITNTRCMDNTGSHVSLQVTTFENRMTSAFRFCTIHVISVVC